MRHRCGALTYHAREVGNIRSMHQRATCVCAIALSSQRSIGSSESVKLCVSRIVGLARPQQSKFILFLSFYRSHRCCCFECESIKLVSFSFMTRGVLISIGTAQRSWALISWKENLMARHLKLVIRSDVAWCKRLPSLVHIKLENQRSHTNTHPGSSLGNHTRDRLDDSVVKSWRSTFDCVFLLRFDFSVCLNGPHTQKNHQPRLNNS